MEAKKLTCDLKERLNLRPIKIEQVLIKTFGNDDEQVHQCEVVQICLKGMNSDLSLYVTSYVVPTICSPLRNQAIEFAKEKYSHLCDLPLADITIDNSDLEVGILIVSDYYWPLTTGQIGRGEAGPVAIEAKLGWVLSGPVCHHTTFPASSVNLKSCTHVLRVATRTMNESVNFEHDQLKQGLARFWQLDRKGISPDEGSVYEQFFENISMKDGRYQVQLLWKETHPLLPDNYNICVNRLQSLLHPLRKDDNLLHNYDQIIREQLDLGIIEHVDLSVPN